MESKYFNSHVFEIKLYHYKELADLHYKLSKILLLICYNSDYCFFFVTIVRVAKKIIILEGTSAHFVVLRYIFDMILGTLMNI